MQSITLLAPAKINLALDVLAKREDSYHELNMLMQSILLADKVSLTKRTDREITVVSDIDIVDDYKKNIAYRAANLIMEKYGLEQGVDIFIEKRIPMQAGLGGGSADAAAVLLAMDELFELAIGRDRLMELGLSLGADVPFCILGGTALAQGIGERLTSLKPIRNFFLLIVKPRLNISTKEAYENLDLEHIGTDDRPDIAAIVSCIEKDDYVGMATKMKNVFEYSVRKKSDIVDSIKDCLLAHGALASLMSGSGSAVFGLFLESESASLAKRGLEEEFLACASVEAVFLTKIYDDKEE